MKPISAAVRIAGVSVLLGTLMAAGTNTLEEPTKIELISISFKGGTATEYIASVRKTAGDEINVLTAPEAVEVRMPPVTLKLVTVSAALRLLDGRRLQGLNREVRLVVTALPVYVDGERLTYRIDANVRGHTGATEAHVWTVAHLLDNDISSKAVLSVVEMALDVVDSTTKMDVRFHEDTGLLIAVGDERQMAIIDTALDRLEDSVNMRREDAIRHLSTELEAAIQRLAITTTEKEEATIRVSDLRQELDRLEIRTAEMRRMLGIWEQELSNTREELRATRMALEKEKSRRDGTGSGH